MFFSSLCKHLPATHLREGDESEPVFLMYQFSFCRALKKLYERALKYG